VVALFFFSFTSHAFAEWKEKVLYSFQGLPDGGYPVGSVVFDKAGNLYGATQEGGSSSCASIYQCGTVYQLAPPAKKGDTWTETVLHIFQGNAHNDGASPQGGLIIDSAGNLYGSTAYGGTGNCVLLGSLMGCGTVYELSPPKQKGGAWTEAVLYSFPTAKRGYAPWGDLVFDSGGNLYGATQFGGGYGTTCDGFYQYCGAVYELSPPTTKGGRWTEKVLHGFKAEMDGANPNGGLALDGKGAVFGTSYSGGGSQNCRYNGFSGCGTAFKLSPPAKKGGAWSETVIHRFAGGTSDGGNPMAGLRLDASGNLYGTTLNGVRGGTVFSLAPPAKASHEWKESVLHGFDENNGPFDPEAGLIFDQSGNLYGTTYVGNGWSLQGSVFWLKPPNGKAGPWAFHAIHGFLGPPDGEFPAAGLVFDNQKDLYSTTQAGGTGTGCGYGGCGTVFKVSP
jgi:hypothetical protein